MTGLIPYLVPAAIIGVAVVGHFVYAARERRKLEDRVLVMETEFKSHNDKVHQAVGHELREIKSALGRVEQHLFNGGSR